MVSLYTSLCHIYIPFKTTKWGHSHASQSIPRLSAASISCSASRPEVVARVSRPHSQTRLKQKWNKFDSKELLSAARTGRSHFHSAALYDEHYQAAHCQTMSVLQKYLSLATTDERHVQIDCETSIGISSNFVALLILLTLLSIRFIKQHRNSGVMPGPSK